MAWHGGCVNASEGESVGELQADCGMSSKVSVPVKLATVTSTALEPWRRLRMGTRALVGKVRRSGPAVSTVVGGLNGLIVRFTVTRFNDRETLAETYYLQRNELLASDGRFKYLQTCDGPRHPNDADVFTVMVSVSAQIFGGK